MVTYSDDSTTIEDIIYDNNNVWLTESQIATLYNRQRPIINEHINNIFNMGELNENVVSSLYRLTTPHGAMPVKLQ